MLQTNNTGLAGKMNIHRILEFIGNIPRNLKYGFKNLIIWFPVIWRDQQWDYYYLFEILEKKLKLMEKDFRNDPWLENSYKKSLQMKRCIELINRIKKEDYEFCYEEYNAYIKENGIDEYAEFWENRVNNGDGTFTRSFEWEQKRDDIFWKCVEKESEHRKKDMDELFFIIYNNIEGWWI